MNARSLPTVTVGIPAYNEEANIGYLLEDLLRQREEGFVLEKIIVSSDGSSDGTVPIARQYAGDKVVVLDNKDRKGRAARQNEIFSMATSDVVVLVDADVILYRHDFLKQVVKPIAGGSDLVASEIDPLPPKTMVEGALYASMLVKNLAFRLWRKGNNIYTCTGVGRAFSRRFYSGLRVTDSVGEDAYSYLACLHRGFSYAYAREARIGIRLPDNIRDHERQSFRFHDSQKRFYREFGRDRVLREYALPRYILSFASVSVFLERPFSFLLYIGITGWLSIKFRFQSKTVSDTWEIAQSSKVLRTS